MADPQMPVQPAARPAQPAQAAQPAQVAQPGVQPVQAAQPAQVEPADFEVIALACFSRIYHQFCRYLPSLPLGCCLLLRSFLQPSPRLWALARACVYAVKCLLAFTVINCSSCSTKFFSFRYWAFGTREYASLYLDRSCFYTDSFLELPFFGSKRCFCLRFLVYVRFSSI